MCVVTLSPMTGMRLDRPAIQQETTHDVGDDMIMGLSEADCQVAVFDYQQLQAEGQPGQLESRASPRADVPRLASTPIRQQLGMFLVQVGQRMQGVPGGSAQSIGAVAAGDQGATV
jgi:hypothetical protein